MLLETTFHTKSLIFTLLFKLLRDSLRFHICVLSSILFRLILPLGLLDLMVIVLWAKRGLVFVGLIRIGRLIAAGLISLPLAIVVLDHMANFPHLGQSFSDIIWLMSSGPDLGHFLVKTHTDLIEHNVAIIASQPHQIHDRIDKLIN